MEKNFSLGLLICLTMAAITACVPQVQQISPLTTTPVATSRPVLTPLPSPTVELVEITVFFTDSNRYATGTPPFEVEVTRKVPAISNFPEAVLSAFFDGPTPAERTQGLESITSGFTGFRALEIEAGIARVFLNGTCASNGATYTIAQPVMKNLLQFEEVEYVKIYDENGETEQPDGETNSIPFCLEP